MEGLDIDRQGTVQPDDQRAGGDVGAAEEADLIGQADADQRAVRALGAVLQRGGDGPAGGDEAQAVDGLLGELAQFVGEWHVDPLAAGGEVQHTALALVAVLGEDHSLDAQLHPLRVIGAVRDVGAVATFVVDRGDGETFALAQVEPGDEAEPAGGEADGAGVDLLQGLALVRGRLGLGEFRGGGELAAGFVDPAVEVPALDRVAGVLPLPLHPLQVGQAGAYNCSLKSLFIYKNLLLFLQIVDANSLFGYTDTACKDRPDTLRLDVNPYARVA